jgi:hypothetical protein
MSKRNRKQQPAEQPEQQQVMNQNPEPQPQPAEPAPQPQPTTTPAMDAAKAELNAMSGVQIVNLYGSKSNAIRAMGSIGFTTSEIATKLGIIYQHARNVLRRPLKKALNAQRKQQQTVTV